MDISSEPPAAPDLLPILDRWQRHLPLVSRPYAEMAQVHGCSEAELLKRLVQARNSGALGRVGGVVAPNTVGASTLAAVSVPAHEIEAAAACINRYPEVNHNYLREHHYNLWFVVAAENTGRKQAVLDDIAHQLQTDVLDLPLEAEYHVDLGFSLHNGDKTAHRPAPARPVALSQTQRTLLATLGAGLPLEPRPYQSVAIQLGWSEAQLLQQLQQWLDSGLLRRLGLIVRHHELGYTSNAMCVWQVPLAQRDAIGQWLAQQQGVHLCYARPGRGPHWPYNLFCMVHGSDRASVHARVEQIRAHAGLQHCPHAMLFSTRRFKQGGAMYGAPLRHV